MTDKQRLALQNAQPEKHLCVHCKKVLEQEWRRPEPTLHIFSEEEKHGTTD